MSAFDKVIGYDSIKKELLQVIDMIHCKDVYKEMGAKIPQGILLYGDPGLGKTLMAKCFVEDAGLQTYTVRRTKSNDFVEEISNTFKKAKENAPSIIFLDDMDKFANEDCRHSDTEEYVAVQAGIDETIDSGVFVLATVNDMIKLPRSLKRAGRFDIKVNVLPPVGEDARKIIDYYLSDKKVSDQVCMDDFYKMITYSSCSELEMVINQAAIFAVSKGKGSIEMDELVEAVLRTSYDSPDGLTIINRHELEIAATHEAGHAVAAELLCPGSVGFVSLRSHGRHDKGGFVHMCDTSYNAETDALIALGGRVAGEMYFAEEGINGSEGDLYRAGEKIRRRIFTTGSRGLGLGDVDNRYAPNRLSEDLNSRIEAVTCAEMERCMFRVKSLLYKNRPFVEKIRDALLEKKVLLHSDIQKIKNDLYCGFPGKAA